MLKLCVSKIVQVKEKNMDILLSIKCKTGQGARSSTEGQAYDDHTKYLHKQVASLNRWTEYNM